MSLEAEFEARRGLPYIQIFNEVQAITHDVVGPIEGKDLRDVVTVLASGLDHRLQMAEPSALRTGLIRAFNSMNINEFGFNLADPLVAQMLDLGVEAGLVEVNERLWFYGIATKEIPTYPELKLINVINYFEPSKVDGQWHEISATHDRAFTVDLLEDLPEAATIVVQYKENYGDRESAWRHATSLIVHQQGKYRADTPHNGYERRFQWRCEYAITGSVAVL